MILLNHEQHIDEIMSARPSYRERLREIDERILDILYDDEIRRVAYALAELDPDPRPIDKVSALIWLGALTLNFGFIAIGGLMIWEMIR